MGEDELIESDEQELTPIGYIYFIRCLCNGRIKIGFSLDSPNGRFRTHEASSPVEIEKFAMMRGRLGDEGRLHCEFHKYRVKGEWFEPHESLLVYIQENAKAWDDVLARDFYEELRSVWGVDLKPRRGKRGRPRKHATDTPSSGRHETRVAPPLPDSEPGSPGAEASTAPGYRGLLVENVAHPKKRGRPRKVVADKPVTEKIVAVKPVAVKPVVGRRFGPLQAMLDQLAADRPAAAPAPEFP